jgi:hypothetical protein
MAIIYLKIRARGYCTYLPENTEDAVRYWSLKCGIKLAAAEKRFVRVSLVQDSGVEVSISVPLKSLAG